MVIAGLINQARSILHAFIFAKVKSVKFPTAIAAAAAITCNRRVHIGSSTTYVRREEHTYIIDARTNTRTYVRTCMCD